MKMNGNVLLSNKVITVQKSTKPNVLYSIGLLKSQCTV